MDKIIRKMVNIRLDEGLWRDAKIQAIKEGKTLQVFVEGVLRDRIQGAGELAES